MYTAGRYLGLQSTLQSKKQFSYYSLLQPHHLVSIITGVSQTIINFHGNLLWMFYESHLKRAQSHDVICWLSTILNLLLIDIQYYAHVLKRDENVKFSEYQCHHFYMTDLYKTKSLCYPYQSGHTLSIFWSNLYIANVLDLWIEFFGVISLQLGRDANSSWQKELDFCQNQLSQQHSRKAFHSEARLTQPLESKTLCLTQLILYQAHLKSSDRISTTYNTQ